MWRQWRLVLCPRGVLFSSQKTPKRERYLSQSLQENLNEKIFDNLLSFIKKSNIQLHSKQNDWSYRMRCSEIPAAAVVLGVNVPDHEMTFQNLSDLLKQSLTPHVVCLQGKECTTVKHVLQKVLINLMGGTVNDEEEDEEGVHHSVHFSQRKMHCSMASLAGWYSATTQKSTSNSPSKKRKSPSLGQEQSPPIVIIFKDLESFLPKVLQDFIVISSNYIQQLPLVLVFGIATSPITLHRMLPHAVSSLLCIELFQSLSCTDHLTTVIDKLVLTTKFPFKLNGKVLQVLISIFLYHDFSVRNFVKGLQLSLLEHFYSHPLSLLCCTPDEANARVQNLTHDDCELIRQVPSFMGYVDHQDSEKQVKLLTNDQYLKDDVQKLLTDLHIYHQNYFPILKCLHVSTSSLPKYPLGKQIRELYITCLERNIWETEEYSSAFQLLGMMAKDELVCLLQKCMEVLKSFKQQTAITEAMQKLEEFLTNFQKLDDVAAVAEVKENEDQKTSPRKSLQEKTDLYQLQKTLMEMKKSRRSKKLSRFEVLRKEVLEFLDKLVRQYLLPPETQPLHEVVYFSAASTIRRHLNAAPRTALQTALSNPYYYLQNDVLRSEGGSITNTAPDICIVYKLHLECGRLINLYDWLQAFVTVVSAAEEKDPDKMSNGQVDEVLHARFIRAVSELEFLGFIKPTKQKTDHVARLTWGGL
ncbi:origin recognition complex subunit 3 isoform X2 [Carcharodon carcharias]|uniref:origin recognition complex subunit 3 isoform X2 n=1 Tax=Carcharodon carcharias TaxID=13397 RepID=UPI001B7E81A2|nr:origin recognition complex subunit 3 isoform X2 [Carcharodon carcharias]